MEISSNPYTNMANSSSKLNPPVKIDPRPEGSLKIETPGVTKSMKIDTKAIEENSIKLESTERPDRQSVADLIREQEGQVGLKVDITI